MYSQKLNEFLYLIDLKPSGIGGFISSYVLKGEKAAIIEVGPASSVNHLLAGLREIGIPNKEISYVAVSHIHIDHAGGAGILLRHLPNAYLVVHKRGAPHLVAPKKLWTQAKLVLGIIAEMYGEPVPVEEDRIIVARDGMTLDLGSDLVLRVLETLGHASHHLSFYESVSRGIFTGDAAGIYINKFDVILPTTPAPFRLDLTLASLEKLIKESPKRLYYTHFGPAHNAVEKLKAHADQLKLWGRIVLEGMKEGKDAKEIRERILKEDTSIGSVVGLLKRHRILARGVITQNVQGFIQYFQKFKGLSIIHSKPCE